MKKSLSPKDTHGPVVQTGPTAGQNRSRNSNGQWRRKRSDAGKPRSFEGLLPGADMIESILNDFGFNS